MDQTPIRRRLGLDASTVQPPANPDSPWEPIAEEPVPTPARRIRVRGAVRELLETAIFILLVFFIVRGIVQNFKIEGSSMEPTLHNEQYILVNKLVYFHFDINAPLRLLPGQGDAPARVIYPFHQPQRGDIIVFEYPKDRTKDYIKRVIGVAGDSVEVREGAVFVNGLRLDEPYLEGLQTFCYTGYACNGGPVVVPEGTVFVMGDNRNNSSDSREWGPLSFDRVIGQAWLLYYPVQDWGLVPHYEYSVFR
jgi:signal peptidase I